jgi:hypothetical protein
MIKTVVREHHWTPDQIAALSLYDETDPGSLEFWYNDCLEIHES